jgi:predicted nuclease of restriction endonuclease-like (RecB) superfamily
MDKGALMDKTLVVQDDFNEITQLINAARQRAVQAVNTSLIELYWQVGQTISRKISQAEWGDGVVAQLAAHLAWTQPGLRGFTRPNLFRMKQFYEAYQGDEKVSPLVRQLPWTHNHIILNQTKRPEEREFYLRLAIREKWSKRELERQLKSALFERTVLNPVKVAPVLAQTHPDALSIFKDSYLVEFLDLPQGHAEADLHQGLLLRLKEFLIELGRDFCFVGS